MELQPHSSHNNSPIIHSNPHFLRYPFNGKSLYLIDKIMLIGYNPLELPLLLTNQKDLQNKFTLNEKPSILNSISSDYTKISLENDHIIDLIFPESPLLYIKDSSLNSKDIASSRNIIFSFNVPYQNNSKTSLNYYTYLYYELITIKGITYYHPKGICFLSNYPYYINYKHLAEFIRNITNLPAPIEYYLYNIVHLPSPINASYKLRYYPSSRNNHYEPLIFKQLSGYPLMQLNLGELFNIFSVENIIKIFVFTFLEIDIIFFIEDLEILNMVMFIFANLNYPCNDSPYFMHVLSVSMNCFENNRNVYVTKTFSSMLGITSPYKDVLSKTQKEDFLAVNIRMNKLIYLHKLTVIDMKDIEDNNALLKYIEMIIKNKCDKPLGFFGKAVKNLYDKLALKSTKETVYNMNDYHNFFSASKEKNIINLESGNRIIQECFYSFILEILGYLGTLNRLEYPNNKIEEFYISYNDDYSSNNNDMICREELIFVKKFKDCSKYNTYIDNFIQHNDAIDVLKIPLLFLEEFIHENKCHNNKKKKKIRSKAKSFVNGLGLSLGLGQIIENDENIKKTFNLFDTIDLLYGIDHIVGVLLDLDYYFDLKSNDNKNNGLNEGINMLDLVDFWHLKRNNTRKIHTKSKICQQNFFKYHYYVINQTKKDKEDNSNSTTLSTYYSMISFDKLDIIGETTLSKLATYKDDYILERNYKRTFYLQSKNLIHFEKQSRFEKCKNFFTALNGNLYINSLLSVNSLMIQEHVEKSLLNQKKFSRDEIIFCCYMMLFAVSSQITNIASLQLIDKIIIILKAKTHLYSFRKYVSLFIILFANIIIEKEKNNIEEDCAIEKQCLKNFIVLFKEQKCLPNEELMQWLNLHSALMINYTHDYDNSTLDNTLDNTTTTINDNENHNESILQETSFKSRKRRNNIYKKETTMKDRIKYDCNYELLGNDISINVLLELANNVEYKGKLFNYAQVKDKTTKDIPLFMLNYDNTFFGEHLYSPLYLYDLLIGLVSKQWNNYADFNKKEKQDLVCICGNLLFYIGEKHTMIYEDYKKIPIEFIYKVLIYVKDGR